MFKVRKEGIVSLWNKNGFTMLEVIFSFAILCLFISFVPLFINVLPEIKGLEKQSQELEFELFVNQLNVELQGSSYINVRNNKLYLISNNQSIQVEKYNSMVRRLVQAKGHEVVLQNVKSVQFVEEGQSIRIIVQDFNNQHYEDQLFSFTKSVDPL